MPASQYEYDAFAAGNVATPNSAEGVVCTSRAVSSSYGGCSFGVAFAGLFTAGASTTSVTFRIRQASLTGTALLTAAGVTIAAAQVFPIYFATVDGTLGDSTGALWVLTAQQAAGAAPGGLTNGYSSITVPT